MKKLLFEVQDECILLWVDDRVAISFADLYEWRDFASQMTAMIPEMVEHNGVRDE